MILNFILKYCPPVRGKSLPVGRQGSLASRGFSRQYCRLKTPPPPQYCGGPPPLTGDELLFTINKKLSHSIGEQI